MRGGWEGLQSVSALMPTEELQRYNLCQKFSSISEICHDRGELESSRQTPSSVARFYFCVVQHDLETEITIIVISKLAPNLWI